MTSLLHLDSSHSNDSVSRRLTASFARTWRERHGPAGYRHRDLAADPVALLSPAYVALGTRVERHGVVPLTRVPDVTETPAERHEWALTLPLINELLAAGTVLIGAPMYNFSIPACLKAWIDRVTFPGAFTDPTTGQSLLSDTLVIVVTARGGYYGPGSPREGFDFQTPYLRGYFTNLGVTQGNLRFVRAEFTRASDIPALAGFEGQAATSLATAQAELATLAGDLVTERS
jgi:FMN-dependent NADH-azoreductase